MVAIFQHLTRPTATLVKKTESIVVTGINMAANIGFIKPSQTYTLKPTHYYLQSDNAYKVVLPHHCFVALVVSYLCCKALPGRPQYLWHNQADVAAVAETGE